MRALWIGLAMVVIVAACAQPPAPTPSSRSSATSARSGGINPANIRRVAREMPSGYEVTQVPRAASPRAIWGLGSDAAADPPSCQTLADPAGAQSAQGVSGSGSGGILDVVVVTLPGQPTTLDRNVVMACPHWNLSAGRTIVDVGIVDAPHIDGAETIGMVADIRAAVESGSEIDSRAYTFGAYLGGFYAFTTLTSDPGSMLRPLPSQYAANLLVKTVSTLRG